MLKEIVKKNRSYRRFDQSFTVSESMLRELAGLVRYVPSAANRQAVRCLPVARPDPDVFSCLGWAAALPDWPGPKEGERPSAYIVLLTDRTVGKAGTDDVGIAAQTILLAAVEQGLGGCMLGNVNRKKLAELLKLDPERYEIELVLALGKPVEDIRIVDVPESGDTRYYRDQNGVHYVPKRPEEVLILRDSRE